MQGIREQLALYDAERKSAHVRTIALGTGVLLLTLLVAALIYIVQSRKRHLRQMERAYNHALESDRMKTAFIRNVSHEVRTPLNIISGFAQIIANPDLAQNTKDRQHMAQMMQKNTRQITSLIDEVLELSNSESAESAVKEDKVQLNGFLTELQLEFKEIISSDVSIKVDSALDDNFTLITNQTLLKRAISTLVDNAIKNTSEGSITLKASVADALLTIAVEDTGCGIPSNEAEHIFERFIKLDSFKEGLGLGLPLCRTLVNRLGGTTSLDTSYEGPGARFVITLPIEE